METGTYKIYFKLWPTKYFLARHKDLKYWCIMKKIWNEEWFHYQWKEI